jgi:hypothetical protein
MAAVAALFAQHPALCTLAVVAAGAACIAIGWWFDRPDPEIERRTNRRE